MYTLSRTVYGILVDVLAPAGENFCLVHLSAPCKAKEKNRNVIAFPFYGELSFDGLSVPMTRLRFSHKLAFSAQKKYNYCMKTCSQCKKELSLENFNRHSSNPDGLEYSCKECRRQKRILRADINKEVSKQWRKENKDRADAQREKWITEHPETYKQSQQAWRERNRDKKNQWVKNHRKRNLIKDKEWRDANRDKIRHYRKQRKCLERNVVGTFTYSEWICKCDEHGWQCFYCHTLLTQSTVTQDHMIPLSKGGTNELFNVVPCCSRCNSRKKDKTVSEFIIYLSHDTK